jgi:hypothetical protein
MKCPKCRRVYNNTVAYGHLASNSTRTNGAALLVVVTDVLIIAPFFCKLLY